MFKSPGFLFGSQGNIKEKDVKYVIPIAVSDEAARRILNGAIPATATAVRNKLAIKLTELINKAPTEYTASEHQDSVAKDVESVVKKRSTKKRDKTDE